MRTHVRAGPISYQDRSRLPSSYSRPVTAASTAPESLSRTRAACRRRLHCTGVLVTGARDAVEPGNRGFGGRGQNEIPSGGRRAAHASLMGVYRIPMFFEAGRTGENRRKRKEKTREATNKTEEKKRIGEKKTKCGKRPAARREHFPTPTNGFSSCVRNTRARASFSLSLSLPLSLSLTVSCVIAVATTAENEIERWTDHRPCHRTRYVFTATEGPAEVRDGAERGRDPATSSAPPAVRPVPVRFTTELRHRLRGRLGLAVIARGPAASSSSTPASAALTPRAAGTRLFAARTGGPTGDRKSLFITSSRQRTHAYTVYRVPCPCARHDTRRVRTFCPTPRRRRPKQNG